MGCNKNISDAVKAWAKCKNLDPDFVVEQLFDNKIPKKPITIKKVEDIDFEMVEQIPLQIPQSV